MYRYFCCALVLTTPSIVDAQSYADSLVVAPHRVGAITADSSADTLAQIYGRANVVVQRVYLGEGYSEPGTAVFPDDSSRTLFITWKDTTNARRPALIQVIGDAWLTEEGIKLGTTLKTLERLNGGHFTMTGFGWDYSGTILSWDGGHLETLSQPHGRVLLRLRPGLQEYDRSVIGDRDINSRHQEMQRLNPIVYNIWVSFH